MAFVCGAFVALMARLEDLAEVSLGPVRAKMREALSEAAATIKQLRQVAASLATSALSELMAGSFQEGIPLTRRLELYDQVMEDLDKLGILEEQRRQATAEWQNDIHLIYCRIIRMALDKQSEPNV
jgi:hypothetical protein